LPSRPWPLWFLTGLLLIGFPTVSFIYWSEVLRSGVLPPDGDSIGIPIFGDILAILLLSPLILGIAWLSLRRYNSNTRLAAWRQDRPFRSVAATVLSGSGAVVVATLVLADIGTAMPWYDYLWRTYFGLWLPWLLGVRAAAVDQLDHEPSYTER